MVQLTDVQRKALEFIIQHSRNTGFPPTLRELAAGFGWRAVGSAQDVVGVLRRKGLLGDPIHGKSRQLVPTELALRLFSPETDLAPVSQLSSGYQKRLPHPALPGLVMVPLLGRVPAGLPVENSELAGELIPFPFADGLGDRAFALEVEGYSMVDAGFLPGDIILVESCGKARNGDIVVASIQGGEQTVKRLAEKGSRLYTVSSDIFRTHYPDDRLPPSFLVPENKTFEPIPFGLSPFDRILGVVRALHRVRIHGADRS